LPVTELQFRGFPAGTCKDEKAEEAEKAETHRKNRRVPAQNAGAKSNLRGNKYFNCQLLLLLVGVGFHTGRQFAKDSRRVPAQNAGTKSNLRGNTFPSRCWFPYRHVRSNFGSSHMLCFRREQQYEQRHWRALGERAGQLTE